MGWRTYVDQLKEIQGVELAAIDGFDGRCWAGDAEFVISGEEIKAINQRFKDGEAEGATGLMVGGKFYLVIDKDEYWVQLRYKTVPLCIYKEDKRSFYLICKGQPEAIPGEISDEMYKVWNHLQELD